MASIVDIYPSLVFILLTILGPHSTFEVSKRQPKLLRVLLFTRSVLQSLGNSNFAIKVSHRFCLMLSRTMYFSSCFLPFQNLYVIGAFFLMSFFTDVFHAFTEIGGCVRFLTSLASVVTKR
jgi:hypothetical protein